MSLPLAEKNILLGVTGGIAAYKVADWVRSLRRHGASVTVVMTEAATRFVSPLTFAALSGNKVESEIFDPLHPESIAHISLAHRCDLLLIAPATANTIAQLAHGMANSLLSAIALATKAPVIICPAMNSAMYLHPATQDNLNRLNTFGYTVISPECGKMACGDEGPGRLPEWPVAEAAVLAALSPQDLAGRQLLITAGPTQEPLDPVRFISNRSTGKMGFALARAARQRGAAVTLIAGPSAIPPPVGVVTISIRTAEEMRQAVMDHYDEADVIIKSAAVSDFRPLSYAEHKIKKKSASPSVALTANPDILLELGTRKGKANRPILVGFAAESQNHLAEGKRKLKSKNLDLLIANDILQPDRGFASDTNQITIIGRHGDIVSLPMLSKDETAHRILDRILPLISL